MVLFKPTSFPWTIMLTQVSWVKASFSGDGTMYGGNANGGACGFSQSWTSWTDDAKMMTAAINGKQWEEATTCGRCASVQHRDRSPIVIQITDICNECAMGALDLAPGAWESILGVTPGREKISWDFVECTSTFVKGDLYFVVKEGSNDNWSAFQPQNYAVGVTKVSIKQAGSSEWESLTRDESVLTGLYFVYDGTLKAPFQISATSLHGEEVISPEFKSMRDALDCKGQFSNSNSEPNTEIEGPATKPTPSPPSKLPPPIQSPPPTEKKADTTTTPSSNSPYPSSPEVASGPAPAKVVPSSSPPPPAKIVPDPSPSSSEKVVPGSRPPPPVQVSSGTSGAPTIRSRRCTLGGPERTT